MSERPVETVRCGLWITRLRRGRVFGTRTHRSDESHELIDRPLIVRVAAVLEGEHATIRRDQKIGWQPERTTVRHDGRNRSTLANSLQNAVKNCPGDRHPSAGVEQSPRRSLHAELSVEPLVGICNDRERQIALVMK